MVRQATERLCTDDIRVAAFNKLHHFRSQEPALAHLAAVADDACDELFEVRIRGRHSEAVRNGVRVLHGADNVAFDADEVVKEDLHNPKLRLAAAEKLNIFHAVIDFKQHEAKQTRHHRFAVLAEQELFQIVVADGRILDVNFADNTNAHFLFAGHGHVRKILRNLRQDRLHLLCGVSLFLCEHIGQLFRPIVHKLPARARLFLIRSRLVVQQHQKVAVRKHAQRLADHRQRQLEAAVFLESGHVERNDRNIRKAVFFQRLSQKVNVVRSTAAAARLGDDERRFMQIIFAAVQRVHHLADGEQRRVAGIVVDIFQALVHNLTAARLENLHVVAVRSEQVFK